MFLVLLSVVGGFVFLSLGAEGLLRGSIALGKFFKLPPHLMGLTLVSLGTASPALFVALRATLSGSPALAGGSILGLPLLNLLFVLPLAAVLAGKVPVPTLTWQRQGLPALALMPFLAAAIFFLPQLSHLVGLALLALLSAYLGMQSMLLHKFHVPVPHEVISTPRLHPLLATGLTAIGIAALFLGSTLVVNGVDALATMSGKSQTSLGLTLVALGVALPEITTIIIAALHKQTAALWGLVIGNTTVTLLGVLGLVTFLHPLSFSVQITHLVVWILPGVAAAFILSSRAGSRLIRAEGLVWLAAFILYLYVLLV